MNSNSTNNNNIYPDIPNTYKSKEEFDRLINDPYFRDNDQKIIYEALINNIKSFSFCDYLKRELLSYVESESDMLDYLCEMFKKEEVPPSFSSASGKIRNYAKNWLSQRFVSRDTVLLLGFALNMSPEKVNELLFKGLKETKLNPKDPKEVLCWYCYRFYSSKHPYQKYKELSEKINSLDLVETAITSLHTTSTLLVRQDMESITNDEELINYIAMRNLKNYSKLQSVGARKQFDFLYEKACNYAAEIKTNMDRIDAKTKARYLSIELSHNKFLSTPKKEALVQKEEENYYRYKAEDISPTDLEDILYSGIQKDKNGNLLPMNESDLNLKFYGKRLSRQRITEILEGKGIINRFDIITLAFFVFTEKTKDSIDYNKAKDSDIDFLTRYKEFITTTNNYLRESDMEPLYIANPYECFILMCVLTDYPLCSFSDIWERSYDQE